MDARLVLRVEAYLTSRRVIARLPIRVHRIIAELLIFEQQPEHIDTEAIDPSVQPEVQDIIHRLAHLLIAPVQIRLFHIEQVQVVLPGVFIELPGRPAKPAGPVIGRTTIGSRISPDVPVAFLVGAVGTRLLEPGMLIGGVIRHKVQNDLKVALVGLLKQRIQVLHGSEERMDIGVIANVIAKIGHRRRVDRREPDRVNAEPAYIVQLPLHTRKISYSVPIAIEKTAWVDLINHARLPPGVRMHHELFCSSSRKLFL